MVLIYLKLNILISSFQTVFICNMDHKTIQIAYKSKCEINTWDKLDKGNIALDKE